MSVFVDTSAVYALLDVGDSNHARAMRPTESLLGEELATHSYVVVELVSLVRRRLVDRTSFEFMRLRGIRRAWAMASDFATEGFELEA